MNDPFIIAVSIIVFAVVVCTIAGIVLAREFYPFVSTREVEISVIEELHMNTHELELVAGLHRRLQDALRRGHFEVAQFYQDEVNELVEQARLTSELSDN
jgi:hypothetical protein